MNALIYFLIASLYLLFFYGCYVLLLRRTTFFGLNRAYLVGAVLVSLALPFVKIPRETFDTLPIGTITLPEIIVGNATKTTWSETEWLWVLYGLGVTYMLVRLVINVRTVLRLIRQGIAERKATYTLIRLPNNQIPSFSFGPYLVLNQTDSVTEPDALLRHEEAHIRQRHTIDVVFLELIHVAFWFNPLLIAYKRALQEVHEFLADKAVLQTPQPDYPRQLVAYALNVSPLALTTSFVSKSTLKQRIVMLQKPASNRRALFGYVLILPLAAGLFMCTQQDSPATESTTKNARVEGEVFTVVENQPEFPGGMAKLQAYLADNLKYPAAAEKANIQGKVFVNFVVTKEGDITDVKILKGIGFGADEEAVRVMKLMPRWKPGMQNGEAVNVRYNLPINFQLE